MLANTFLFLVGGKIKKFLYALTKEKGEIFIPRPKKNKIIQNYLSSPCEKRKTCKNVQI